MDLKLEERLFPHKAREHNELSTNKWNHEYFNTHLEIDSIKKILDKLSPDTENDDIKRLINHLEPDLDKIQFRQELCKYILSQEGLLRNISKVFPINIQATNDQPEYPMKVFREYKRNLNLILEGIDSTTEDHPYFTLMKDHLHDALKVVMKAEKDIRTQYELRAEFHAKLTKTRRYPHSEKNTDLTIKIKIDDDYTIFVHEAISGEIQSIRKKKTKVMKDHYSYNIRLCDVPFHWSEIEEGIIAHAEKILSSNHQQFKENETIDMHTVLTVDQAGHGKYTTTGIYTLMTDKKTVTDTIKSTNSQGLPFSKAFFQREEWNLERIIRPIVRNLMYNQVLFENVMGLAAHAQISKSLIAHGATFAEYSRDPSEQIIMKDMRSPALVLMESEKNKKIIGNDVHITNDNNVILLTGANFNGKSTYGIGIAQNLVLTQASLPGFFSYAKIRPRKQFLTLFSDYGGNLQTGESKHSKECVDLKSVLTKISPDSYIFIDEVGTGTDPEDGKNIGRMIFRTLSKLKDIAAIGSTHYKDMVADLAKECPNVQPIAFNFNKDNEPTYKGIVGEVAKTSAGSIIAAQKGLGPKDFESFSEEWKAKGWTR